MNEDLIDPVDFEVVAAMTRELMAQRHFRAPHEDDRVLHAPGECLFCDGFPDWQQARHVQQINFTGQRHEHRAACPSETVDHPRYETITRFHDNRPVPRRTDTNVDVEIRWLRR